MKTDHNPNGGAALIAETQEIRDDVGRKLPAYMTDREIAEESLILLRGFYDALTALSASPMAAMVPGLRQ
jgi:hypothetical protein